MITQSLVCVLLFAANETPFPDDGYEVINNITMKVTTSAVPNCRYSVSDLPDFYATLVPPRFIAMNVECQNLDNVEQVQVTLVVLDADEDNEGSLSLPGFSTRLFQAYGREENDDIIKQIGPITIRSLANGSNRFVWNRSEKGRYKICGMTFKFRTNDEFEPFSVLELTNDDGSTRCWTVCDENGFWWAHVPIGWNGTVNKVGKLVPKECTCLAD